MTPRGLGLGTRVSRSREYRDDLDKLLVEIKTELRKDEPRFAMAQAKLEHFQDRWQEIVELEREAVKMERKDRLAAAAVRRRRR